MNHLALLLSFFFLFLCLNLFAQTEEDQLSIQYKPFSKRIFLEGVNPISKKDFEAKLESNPLAYKQYQTGKKMSITGMIISIPTGVVFGFKLGTWLGGGEKPSGTLFTISSIGWSGGMLMGIIGEGKIKKAIKTYNASEEVGWKFQLNENGAGLVMRF